MEGEGLLLAFAQIGVIVAGFAGVAASLRQVWTASERVQFQILVVASLAIMFFALLPPILFYVMRDAQVSVRLASAGYGLYVAQIMTRRVRAFRRARTPLRIYLSTIVFGSTVALLLMLLNVAFFGSPGVHALGLLPALYVATLQFRLFVTPPAPPRTS
jgi:Na+-transporting NADH:ubiquinone oxidoreductase subunit NqrD